MNSSLGGASRRVAAFAGTEGGQCGVVSLLHFRASGAVGVVLFLVTDVADDIILAVFVHGECAVAALPREPFSRHQGLADEARGTALDVLHQVRKADSAAQPDKQMHMVRHSVDRQHVTAVVLTDIGNVAMEPTLN